MKTRVLLCANSCWINVKGSVHQHGLGCTFTAGWRCRQREVGTFWPVEPEKSRRDLWPEVSNSSWGIERHPEGAGRSRGRMYAHSLSNVVGQQYLPGPVAIR